MSETKIICPCCGAEFLIPEHQHAVSGIAIGKDSNLGIIHPVVVKPGNKALQRIQALKDAGISGNYFATSEGRVARLTDDNIIETLSDDDPVFESIINGGTINNRNLFRRWVMAQVFRGLDSKGGFVKYVHFLGYRYQWKMLIEEIRVQARMEKDNAEEFAMRNLFFNKRIAEKCAYHYVKNLQLTIEAATEHTYKKQRKYKRIFGKDYFVDDIAKKLLSPLHSAIGKISNSSNSSELYGALSSFRSLMILPKPRWTYRQCPEWTDAYKGAGAFYTLKNMLLFHGCHIVDDNGVILQKEAAVDYVTNKAHEYENQGWRLFGILRKCISDNGINVSEKRNEWLK